MPRTLELTLKRPDKSMKNTKQVPSTAIQKKNARFLGSAAGQKNCPVHSLAINEVHTHRTAYPFISGMIAWRYREAIHKKREYQNNAQIKARTF